MPLLLTVIPGAWGLYGKAGLWSVPQPAYNLPRAAHAVASAAAPDSCAAASAQPRVALAGWYPAAWWRIRDGRCWIKGDSPAGQAWRFLQFFVPLWLAIFYVGLVYIRY